MNHYFNIISKTGNKRKNYNAVMTVKHRPQYAIAPGYEIVKFTYARGHGWIWKSGRYMDLAILPTEKDDFLQKALNKLWKTEQETVATF